MNPVFASSCNIIPNTDPHGTKRKHSELTDARPATGATIAILPAELLMMVFEWLSPKDLVIASRVCQQWFRFANDNHLWNSFDLAQLFPKLTIIIDEGVLRNFIEVEKYGLDPKAGSLPSKRRMIGKLSAFFKLRVEDDAGFTLLTVPKGLSLDKIVRLAEDTYAGPAVGIWRVKRKALDQFKDKFTEKTEVVVITNSILVESNTNLRGLPDEFMPRAPGLIPTALLIILIYKTSEELRYYECPTLCSDPKVDDDHLSVGLFPSSGLRVGRYCTNFGVGAMMKL